MLHVMVSRGAVPFVQVQDHLGEGRAGPGTAQNEEWLHDLLVKDFRVPGPVARNLQPFDQRILHLLRCRRVLVFGDGGKAIEQVDDIGEAFPQTFVKIIRKPAVCAGSGHQRLGV